MNFYKYVLMTMAFVLGNHLYYVITYESMFLKIISENPESAEYIMYMRLDESFSNIITFMFCVALLVIAIVLYLAEFYTCKYINKAKNKIYILISRNFSLELKFKKLKCIAMN